MTDRTALMTAALAASPITCLAAYTTSQLREAALDAEPRLLEAMSRGAWMTAEETVEWFDRVRALNAISAEVLRRQKRDAEIGPHLVNVEDGYRFHPIMAF